MIVHVLVEGRLDSAVLHRLLHDAGHARGNVYGLKGCGYIRSKLSSFAASTGPSFALAAMVDLMDTGSSCCADVRRTWLPHAAPCVVFRVVRRETESWLMADRDGFARFARIPLSKIPTRPEDLNDPKRTLVNLCRSYSKPSVRSRVVPALRSTATEGREYNDCLSEFVRDSWDPARAALTAESLHRARVALLALERRCLPSICEGE